MLGVLAIQEVEKEKNKRRRIWNKDWLKNRENCSHMKLLKELKENNPDDFRDYLLMPDDCFQQLWILVSSLITKQDTVLRCSITPDQRLIATLGFIATDKSLEDLKFNTGISARIVPETCEAINVIWINKMFQGIFRIKSFIEIKLIIQNSILRDYMLHHFMQ